MLKIKLNLKIIIMAFTIFVCIIYSSSMNVIATEENPVDGISAKAYIVMDADSKKVLYAHNADEKLPMASTTKIMSTLIALEQPNLDEVFTVDNNAIMVEGSSMGLVKNAKVTLNALCYGMLLPSGNDAANATAVRVAGSIDKFAVMMNEKASTLGMTNSHFTNPSGLPDKDHYSTAYDMALLGSNAILNEDFVKISSSKKAMVEFGEPVNQVYLTNHNKMLEYYDDCVGIKTGFTDLAGRCLVTGVKRDGINLVCVTLNAPNDWVDHTTLLDMAYDNIYKGKNLFLGESENTLKANVVGGILDEISVGEIPQEFIAFNEDLSKVKTEVLLEKFYYAPISKGDVLGKVVAKIDDKIICENILVANDDVTQKIVERPATKKSLWEWFLGLFK